MSKLFLSVLNMSLTASYVILIVILVRLLLKKAPKFISYALWGVVAFRLIIPFSFESMFSILPRNTNTVPIPHDIIYPQSPQTNSGIGVVDSFISESLPTPTIGASVNPLQIYIEIAAYIWILGIMALLIYGAVSVLLLKRQLKEAQLIEMNIFEAKNLKTPFVLGLIKPKIYLPTELSIDEKNYILIHEQIHIHRKDHIINIFAFLVLCLYWFNPLVWIAFQLMSIDMELSCDEQVLKKVKEDIRKPYANSLLSLAAGKHSINGSPIAFGEGNIKGRINNVLNYKKPRFWVVIASTIVLIGTGIALLSNPASGELDLSFLTPNNILSLIGDQEQVKIVSSNYGNTSVSGRELAKWLDLAENDWKRKNVSSPYELSPDITIHVNDETGNEIRFYESKPTLAMILYQNDYRYYQIPEEDYSAIAAMAGLGYPLVESITFTEHEDGNDAEDQMSFDVESNLAIIMSSPMNSSNPQDYINAHENEYENFMKFGGEDALKYMLSQFEAGNAEGLRGQIMMRLCKELLGVRNNVTDETLSPQEWYDALSIRQEIILPNYEYDGQDPIEKLVYDTEIEKNSDSKSGGFIVIAPKIFGSYEDENLLKVFVTTYSARYKLFGNTLSEEGGSIIPAAITYRKDNSSGYILEKYEQARDGSEFNPSIRKYCTMPVSGKEIKGLADIILEHYSDYEDIRLLLYDNLIKHLKKNGITNAVLTNSQGKIEIPISAP